MNLIKSTGTFSFFTIISRILGYLRDILIAIFLGTSFLADAFFVAFRIPNTFRRLFSEGTFNAAFVPSYSSEILKGKAKSNKFASEVFNLLFLILLILILLVQIFMPAFVSLIAPGFSEDNEKMQLAINLTRITFPFLLLISLASFFAGILNSYNRFAEAAAAPIILNIILIIVLLFSKLLNDNLVYYLSYAVTLAGLLQFIFLYFFCKKIFQNKISFKF
jgi:putative peptidoglycan lipid II flippase